MTSLRRPKRQIKTADYVFLCNFIRKNCSNLFKAFANLGLSEDDTGDCRRGVFPQLMGDVMHYERADNSGSALGHDLEYLILHDNVSVRSKFDSEDDSTDATYKFLMIPSRNPGMFSLQVYDYMYLYENIKVCIGTSETYTCY